MNAFLSVKSVILVVSRQIFAVQNAESACVTNAI
jgi:hypothetical protein